jgi:hypothetical protein
MIVLIAITALITWGVIATLRSVSRDGYRRIPALAR